MKTATYKLELNYGGDIIDVDINNINGLMFALEGEWKGLIQFPELTANINLDYGDDTYKYLNKY